MSKKKSSKKSRKTSGSKAHHKRYDTNEGFRQLPSHSQDLTKRLMVLLAADMPKDQKIALRRSLELSFKENGGTHKEYMNVATHLIRFAGEKTNRRLEAINILRQLELQN